LLESEYTTSQGQIRIDPFFEYDNNIEIGHHNPHLYTGIAMLFKYRYGYILPSDGLKIDYLNDTQVFPGLYKRHTFAWDDIISRDEYLGIVITRALTGGEVPLDEIVSYWEAYHSYSDKDPQRFNIRYWRQPKDIYIYKAIAPSYYPSCFERLYFTLSTFITRARKLGYRNDGDKILLWGALEILSLFGSEAVYGYERAAKTYGYWGKKYGDNFLEAFFRNYFKDSGHPFHTFARYYYENN
jgi:hypothetical protein